MASGVAVKIRRWGGRILLVLCTAVVLAVGWGLTRLRTDGLAARLVQQVADIAARTDARPSQADVPRAGRFAELAVAPLDALAKQLVNATDAELCRAVREGEKPYDETTPGCQRALDVGRAPLHELFAATEAERAGTLPGWAALDAPAQKHAASNAHGVVLWAAKLGELELRERLAASDEKGAAADCVGLLALARDVSRDTGTLGRQAGVGVSDRAFLGCAALVGRTPPALRATLQKKLERVQSGMPSFTDTVREFSAVVLLRGFGGLLGKRLESLPPAAREIAQLNARPVRYRPLEAFWLKDFWHRAQDRMDAFVAASQLPAPARFDALNRADARDDRALNPLSHERYPDLTRLAMVDERSRDELWLLRCALALEAGNVTAASQPTLSSPPGCRADTTLRYRLEKRDGRLCLVDTGAPRSELVVPLQKDPG